MWPVFSAHSTLFVIGVLFVVAMISARLIQPEWWKTRAVRATLFVAFAGVLGGVALWSVGARMHHMTAVRTGAALAYGGVLILAPAIAVLPLTATLDRLALRLVRAKAPTPASAIVGGRRPARLSRRALLRATTSTIPAMAAVTGASGLVTAGQPPRMPVIPMRYEGLHPDLEGFRILQLSDLHLGAYLGLDDLAKGLEAALAQQRPDLIVLTGDLSDDPGLIPAALELVARAAPRHGALASLGNHEYLRDIDIVRPLYEAGPIPLLVSAGRTIEVGRAKLFVGGADDPVHMKGAIAKMLHPSIAEAASHAPAHADFRLLLCHRPEGFAPAVEHGFDLTLAGHTHGGQLGLFGRSALELLSPGTGWWGTYERKRPSSKSARRSVLASSPSRLYTTAGFGHWFPFRVGCPTEMPLIVLEGVPRSGEPSRV